MNGIPDHEVERVLRTVQGRCVVRTVWRGRACVTRVLTRQPIQLHHARAVHAAVLRGAASYASLGDDIAMTLDGYAVAARLLPDPGYPPRWTRVVDAGITTEGYVYVTTEWAEGQALHQVDEGLDGGLDDARREAIVRSLLDVLVSIHACRVAHGDLKLANLVLRADGGITLIDLDTLREVPARDAGVCTLYRTENWAAPETLHRQEVWLGSDLWAFARVVRDLWGQVPPVPWRRALAACRHPDPLRRPTAASLSAHFADPSLPVVDHAGAEIDLHMAAVFEAPTRTNPGAFETDRAVGGGQAPRGTQTERVYDGETERVADASAPTLRPGAEPPPSPVARPRPTTQATASSGCLQILLGMGQFAFYGVVFVVGSAFAGWFAYDLTRQNAADRMAETTLAALKIHKTDPARNGKDERDRLAAAAEEAWSEAPTRRSCAVRALTLVWQQRWHFDDDWSPTDFAAAKAAVSEPTCGREPEALLAKATLYAGACRRRNGDVPAIEDCDTAITALASFWTSVPAGTEWNWLRVEAAWQEVRARTAVAGRYARIGSAEAGSYADAAVRRCDEAVEWVAYAPVNGPEMVEECIVAAGLALDPGRFLAWSDLRLASLPTDRDKRRRLLGALYTWAGAECDVATVAWKRTSWSVAGPGWCRALGSAARRCSTDAAAAIATADPLDAAHPWPELAAHLPSRAGPCLE